MTKKNIIKISAAIFLLLFVLSAVYFVTKYTEKNRENKEEKEHRLVVEGSFEKLKNRLNDLSSFSYILEYDNGTVYLESYEKETGYGYSKALKNSKNDFFVYSESGIIIDHKDKEFRYTSNLDFAITLNHIKSLLNGKSFKYMEGDSVYVLSADYITYKLTLNEEGLPESAVFLANNTNIKYKFNYKSVNQIIGLKKPIPTEEYFVYSDNVYFDSDDSNAGENEIDLSNYKNSSTNYTKYRGKFRGKQIVIDITILEPSETGTENSTIFADVLYENRKYKGTMTPQGNLRFDTDEPVNLKGTLNSGKLSGQWTDSIGTDTISLTEDKSFKHSAKLKFIRKNELEMFLVTKYANNNEVTINDYVNKIILHDCISINQYNGIKQTTIYCNENNILSYSFRSISEGSKDINEIYRSIDLNFDHIIVLKELFLENYEDKLTKIIDLDEYDAFSIRPTGIMFCKTNFRTDSRNIFIPYSEIKEIINPSGPIFTFMNKNNIRLDK